MAKRTDIKDWILIGLFFVAPAIILSNLSNEFADSPLDRILLAGLFGGLGGLLGAGLLGLVNTKTTAVKTISAILLIVVCFTSLVVVKQLNKPILQTCEVCGYKAVPTDKNECDYCGSPIWEEKKKIKGYDNKQEWLRDEQLFWFSLDSLTQRADFYNPEVDEGFEKDKNWKPVITEKDLIDDIDDSWL